MMKEDQFPFALTNRRKGFDTRTACTPLMRLMPTDDPSLVVFVERDAVNDMALRGRSTCILENRWKQVVCNDIGCIDGFLLIEVLHNEWNPNPTLVC